jgi:hypothetical protein
MPILEHINIQGVSTKERKLMNRIWKAGGAYEGVFVVQSS